MNRTRVERQRPVDRDVLRTSVLASPPREIEGRDGGTPPKPIEHEQTRLKPRVEHEPTRLKPRPPTPGNFGFEERLALFAHSLARQHAQTLLEGLCAPARSRAAAYLTAHVALSSAERQGRLAAEFGTRPDAHQRLREVWAEAGPALRQKLFEALPPYHRTLFPDFQSSLEISAEAAPGLSAFAERLIREATR